MNAPSLPSFACASLALGIALCACTTSREEAAGEESGSLDPTSAGSRAKLDAAQHAYGSAPTSREGQPRNDIQMKSFSTGGTDLAMPGYAVNSLGAKSYRDVHTFEGGNRASDMNSRNFAAGLSPMQSQTSPFSQAASREGGLAFDPGSGYPTKTYRASRRGFRLPSLRSPKVIPVEALTQSSPAQSDTATVGDIRTLLNR